MLRKLTLGIAAATALTVAALAPTAASAHGWHHGHHHGYGFGYGFGVGPVHQHTSWIEDGWKDDSHASGRLTLGAQF